MECIREDESFSQHVSSLKSCSTDFPTFYRFLWSPENAGKSEDPRAPAAAAEGAPEAHAQDQGVRPQHGHRGCVTGDTWTPCSAWVLAFSFLFVLFLFAVDICLYGKVCVHAKHPPPQENDPPVSYRVPMLVRLYSLSRSECLFRVCDSSASTLSVIVPVPVCVCVSLGVCLCVPLRAVRHQRIHVCTSHVTVRAQLPLHHHGCAQHHAGCQRRSGGWTSDRHVMWCVM